MTDTCNDSRLDTNPAAPPGHILVADDEDMVRDLLTKFLTKKGYQVTACVDGLEALEAFKARPYDLVLSDVRMPGLSGLQLLQAIKDTNPRVPVVLISGYGEVETVVAALKQGAENFLAKPLKMEQLAKVLEQSLSLTSIKPTGPARLEGIQQTTVINSPSGSEVITEIVYQISLSAVATGFAHFDLDNNLKLALVEAITNAMEHGNQWDPKLWIKVETRINPEFFEVVISDQGQGFDYEHLPDPTHESNLLCERGRGIFLMTSIMDEVTFTPPGNRVTLRKQRLESEETA